MWIVNPSALTGETGLSRGWSPSIVASIGNFAAAIVARASAVSPEGAMGSGLGLDMNVSRPAFGRFFAPMKTA